MLKLKFLLGDKNQKVHTDTLEKYALISAAEHSENNLMIDMQTLTALPINEQVDILNEALPGLNLALPKPEPKGNFSILSIIAIGLCTIITGLGYVIKFIKCPSRKSNSQSSPTNPSESSGSNQGQRLSQSMAEASIGDRSTSCRRPCTRSMTFSQEDPASLNNGRDPLN